MAPRDENSLQFPRSEARLSTATMRKKEFGLRVIQASSRRPGSRQRHTVHGRGEADNTRPTGPPLTFARREWLVARTPVVDRRCKRSPPGALPAPLRLEKANIVPAPGAIPELRDACAATADLECPLPHGT